MKYTLSMKTGEVSFAISKKLYALELLQGTAHVLTDRCVAYVEPKGAGHLVTLKSVRGKGKEDLEMLADAFVNELLNQTVRQKLVAANRNIMDHVITRALVSARADESAPAEQALNAEQQAEIDKLIAEAEEEISALNKRKGVADPLGITKTWEETHGKPRTR